MLTMAAAAVGLLLRFSYLVRLRLRLGKESGGAPRRNYIGSRREALLGC
jgi:hypothetical protein